MLLFLMGFFFIWDHWQFFGTTLPKEVFYGTSTFKLVPEKKSQMVVENKPTSVTFDQNGRKPRFEILAANLPN